MGKRDAKRKPAIVPMVDPDTEEPPIVESSRHIHVSVPQEKRRRPNQRVSHHQNVVVVPMAASDNAVEDMNLDEPVNGHTAFVNDGVGADTEIQCLPEHVAPQRDRVDPVEDWIPSQDIYLDEMLRHEGLGPYQITPGDDVPLCAQCDVQLGVLRCIDCVGGQLFCKDCIVANHHYLPLHRIQRWENNLFNRYSLKEAGLRVQLGHDGRPCPHSRPRDGVLTVLDVSGIHTVAVDWCGCEMDSYMQPMVQFLRARWFPATVDRPRTVVTFNVLKLFHKLNLLGKLNAYDFYHGLESVTDGAGLYSVGHRYKAFLRAVRFYRLLTMTKRAGRGHDPRGMKGTSQGECVVECPRCPHPGRNLPDNWQDAPEETRWLYALILAIDANFKMKRKHKKDTQMELGSGWAYFVEESSYQRYLEDYTDQKEMKHCDSNHSAVDHANLPAQKRFAVTGVGAVICARHGFFRKHGIGDLQRGERYANMDFILLSTLVLTAQAILMLILSYDIACSFYVHFFRRLREAPDRLQFDFSGVTLRWAIPKFHLLAHGDKCQGPFSLNYMLGAARTSGEGIESNWALTNPAALSTREMSSAGRHEVLNDVLGAINWEKTIKTRNALFAALEDAVEELAIQEAAFEELDETVPESYTREWESLVIEYEKSSSGPNPYEEKNRKTSLAEVRLELQQEEAEESLRGVMSPHEMTASTFITVGLDLEEQQYVVRKKRDGAQTKEAKAKLEEKRSVLRNRIRAWRQVQQIYMPFVMQLLEGADAVSEEPEHQSRRSDDQDHKPEFAKLWLPSAIPGQVRESPGMPELLSKEARLREAQADDALHQVRRQIRVRMGILQYKKKTVDGPGQKSNTRARAQISSLTDKLNRFVDRYQRARSVLLKLDPHGEWSVRLRELAKDDVRAPTSQEEGLGRGRQELAWIWRVQRQDERDVPTGDQDTSPDEIHESMRAEWAQTYARVRRWREDVRLLQEEMRRAIAFFESKERDWISRVGGRSTARPDIASGVDAYARRQAANYSMLALSCVTRWRPLLLRLGLVDPWADTPYVYAQWSDNSTVGRNLDENDSDSDALEEEEDE